MSARKELARLLEQWLQLTRIVGEAIDVAAWPDVKRIQARKASLRQPLAEAARELAQEDAKRSPGKPVCYPLRAEVRAYRVLANAQRRSAGHPLAARPGPPGLARSGQAELAENPTILCQTANPRGLALLFLMSRPFLKTPWNQIPANYDVRGTT